MTGTDAGARDHRSTCEYCALCIVPQANTETAAWFEEFSLENSENSSDNLNSLTPLDRVAISVSVSYIDMSRSLITARACSAVRDMFFFACALVPYNGTMSCRRQGSGGGLSVGERHGALPRVLAPHGCPPPRCPSSSERARITRSCGGRVQKKPHTS